MQVLATFTCRRINSPVRALGRKFYFARKHPSSLQSLESCVDLAQLGRPEVANRPVECCLQVIATSRLLKQPQQNVIQTHSCVLQMRSGDVLRHVLAAHYIRTYIVSPFYLGIKERSCKRSQERVGVSLRGGLGDQVTAMIIPGISDSQRQV